MSGDFLKPDTPELTLSARLRATQAWKNAKASAIPSDAENPQPRSTEPTLTADEGTANLNDCTQSGLTFIEFCAPKTTDGWRAPQAIPDELTPVQSFDTNWLPPVLRTWIEDIIDRMQCPPDYPAVGVMVALGSVIGRKIGICPKMLDFEWVVPPNLWGIVVGRPSVMKTPALEQALAPLSYLEEQEAKKHQAALKEYEAASMVDKERASVAKRQIAEALSKKDEARAQALAKAATVAAKAPTARRYKVNDSTVEKLGELLNENPNGLLVYRDELVGLFQSLDKEGQEGARAFYLQAANGNGSFTFDRIGRGTIRIEAAILSALGAIQPGPLGSYLRDATDGGGGDDGLLQRFQLAVWPDVSKEWQNVDRAPDAKARAEVFAVFEYLDKLTPQAVGAAPKDDQSIPVLHFDPTAQKLSDQWREQLEKRVRGDTEHPALEAHFSKYRKLMPALALILHLANRDIGPVKAVAVEKSIAFTAYLESHARRIYSAALNEDVAAARELARHLKRGDLDARFTVRDVYRKGWASLKTRQRAEAAIEILCELNWIQQEAADSLEKQGRPSSPSYIVNPRVLEGEGQLTAKTAKIQKREVVSVLAVTPPPSVEASQP